MKKFAFLLLVITGILLFANCEGDKPVPPPNEKGQYLVAVVNEGNYIDHNGSVDFYDEETGVMSMNCLDISLGATYQSTAVCNDTLWVVTNLPDKIVAFNASTRKATPVSITNNLNTPRYVDFYGKYMFVSNWGEAVQDGEWEPGYPRMVYPNSYIAVFDRSNNYTLVKTLPCEYDVEGILVCNNRLFAATAAGVRVFDITNPNMQQVALVASAQEYAGNAKQLVAGASGNLWASFAGGSLLCINTSNYSAVKEIYPISLDYFTGDIAITKDGMEVISYATDYETKEASVYATDVNSGVQRTVTSGNYNFYSIGVSPYSGYIYTANSSFTTNSSLLIFDLNGNKKKETEAGVGTGHFTFFQLNQ